MLGRLALAGLSTVLLAACAVATPAERNAEADRIASRATLAPLLIETTVFDLHARLRAMDNVPRLTVYIEGDGFAWRRRNEPSTDPTPLDPVALRLAAADDADAVAYLARPCQFTGGEKARNCENALWTSARYSEEALAAMDAAIGALKERAGASKIALVGYSGGGTVATLLAIRRDDIVWLKTVAAPLDTDAFTAHHNVSPLSDSLNPADIAAALANLPQIHYAGSADKVVPASINRDVVARLDVGGCAMLQIVPGPTHDRGWAEIWPELVRTTPACR